MARDALMKTEQDFEHHTSEEGYDVEKLDLLERRHHKAGERNELGRGRGESIQRHWGWAFASSRKGATVVDFRDRIE